MTSNVQAIRAAEAQIPRLQQQLQSLREEALEDDGDVDAEEEAEINRVSGMIEDAQRVISERRQAWEANKAAYEDLRARINSGLSEAVGCDISALRGDQRAVSGAADRVDQAAEAEDFETAIGLASELERLISQFQTLLEQHQENERLAELTPEELAETSLTDGDPSDVFTEEYMTDLMNEEFAGEGDPDLSELMSEIERGVSGPRRAEAMEELAGIVGIPPSAGELDGDYGRFLIILRQQEAIGSQNGSGDVPDLDEERHPDFRGSRSQLMFGRVLGDAFGIHEVFAALLSPTGGLVGPGNDLIPGVIDSPHLSPDNPVALHGTVHDAAGYLKSYHDEGPGYNYRGNEIEAVATDIIELLPESIENVLLPLTGQISGIAYWTMEAGDEYLQARLDEAAAFVERELSDARDAAADGIADVISAVEETGRQIAEEAEELMDAAAERMEEAEEELRDLAEEAETEVLEIVDAIEDGAERAASAAIEAYEEVSAGARSMADAAADGLNAVASFIWS